MKKYSAKFALEDKMRESTASKEQVERRRTQLADFDKWRSELQDQYHEEKEQRLELRGGKLLQINCSLTWLHL
jgi:translation initiation factor 3 subunit B